MRLIVSGVLIIGGLIMLLPMVLFWDAIQIQAALGNTAMLDRLLPLGAGGLGALGLGWFFLPKR